MLPTLNEYQKAQVQAVQLGGLNLTESNGDGNNGSQMADWSWTQNTDAAMQPIIRRREKRIRICKLTTPLGICALDKLAFVDGKRFYWNGYFYSSPVGDTVGNMDATTYKTMIPMGSDIVIFPDKLIFNTKTCTFRSIEQTNTISSGVVTVSLAQADGSSWGSPTISPTAPANPANGDHWLDTSETVAVMKTWNEYTNTWVDEYTTSVSIAAENIGVGLAADDAVEIAGFTETGLTDLNGTWQLLVVEAGRIVITGVIPSAQITQQTSANAAVTVKRTCPDMDFVVEHNNRLWGCSSANHEIYACALGDATNWRRYAGISTDSYAVTVGSPGPFTGAAVVNSSVCFFKENCIHKIYGTAPSNFQMTVDHYRGVEAGSGQSVVRINELVYYKSVFDVCGYNGTEVAGCSAALGTMVWKNAVSGANDRRLYISMKDDAGTWHLLTYDTVSGTWMREDGTHALGFASALTETFMLDASGYIWALRTAEYAKNTFLAGHDYTVITEQEAFGAVEETDADVPWLLRTGEIMARLPNNQWIGKIQLLVDLQETSEMTVKVKKDNEAWETVFSVRSGDERRYTLPIYPRRCDRLMIELSGKGPMKLYNMSWQIEAGSEYGRA